MTANEMIPAVGRKVLVRFEDLEVLCIVRDVKTAWNRPRLRIEPVSGTGSQWVELGRVRLSLPEWLEDWRQAVDQSRRLA